jgi:hypothetical protein
MQLSDVMQAGDMPVEGVPLYAIVVLSYFDEDGDMAHKWHIMGEPSTQDVVGLLEICKLRLMADTYDWDE